MCLGADVAHAVYAKVTDRSGFAVVGDEIVVLVVPHQCPRADDIAEAGGFFNPHFVCVVVEIAEADLSVFTDCRMQGVHRIVDDLALGFDPRSVDLSVQLRRAVAAGLAVQLADQLTALLLGQKFC